MPRVLLVSDRSVAGGAQRSLANLAARLPEHGWEPSALLAEPGPLEDWLVAAGVPVVEEPAGDVVLSLCAKGHLMGGPIAARLGVPAVWWRMLTPRGRPYETEAFAVPAAAIATLTERAAARQRELTPGVIVEAVPPGVDVDVAWRGSGRAIRERLGGPLVGIVGRIDPAKGQDDFLRAAALLGPDVRFAVVGGAIVGHEGDFEARLHALAAELGLAGRVTFTGHVEDPLRWLDALDVAVVASHHEAFGLVCVEALAVGTPVVATATDGPAEILRGPLVPVGDPPALAAAVARALRDPAPNGLAQDFSIAACARRMAALLSRVTRAGGARPSAPAVPAGSA